MSTDIRSQTIPATPKAIREALKNNCLYVYHVWGEGQRARIVNVRMHKGEMQVKHLSQGVWITPGETSSIVQG